jgi:hypothetical protein
VRGVTALFSHARRLTRWLLHAPETHYNELIRAQPLESSDMKDATFDGVSGLKLFSRVWRPSGSQLFYERAGSTDKTQKLYEGHYHDLLNDSDKGLVMTDIQAWLAPRV